MEAPDENQKKQNAVDSKYHDVEDQVVRTVVFSHKGNLVVLKVEPRFVPHKIVGQGAYGIVCAAKDLLTNKDCCIKTMEGVWNRRSLAKRVLRELIFLRHFKGHENIIGLVRVMRPSGGYLKTVNVVSELMDMDLSRVIRSPQELIDDHVQYFTYQILCGLKYIHSAGVLHRDLNPRNMLVNRNCLLKICDFGLARFEEEAASEKDRVPMSDYVCTRWYRAPEVMLFKGMYSKPSDIWSLGCILGELLCRKPIFPGKSEFHQLNLIHKMLGVEGANYMKGKDKKGASNNGTSSNNNNNNNSSNSVKSHFPATKTTPNMTTATNDSKENSLLSSGTPSPTTPVPVHIQKMTVTQNHVKLLDFVKRNNSNVSKVALDLLGKLLRYNPDERLTAEEALKHQYFHEYHDPQEEPDCPQLDPNLFAFEKKYVSKSELKEYIYEEIREHNPKQQGHFQMDEAVTYIEPASSHQSKRHHKTGRRKSL